VHSGLVADFGAHSGGAHPLFKGEFIPLPIELDTRLRAAFPRHRFTIARIYFWPWTPGDGSTNILLVTDAALGEVLAHQGELFYFEGASESFYQFLTLYPATSRKDALHKVKLFSSLMVASAREGGLGDVKLKGRTITAELRLADKPWRILKVQVDYENEFNRISMINAIMKNVVN